MARKGNTPKRQVKPDPVYGDKRIAKFVNIIMRGGKKSTAERIAYGAFDVIKERSKKEADLKGDPVNVFFTALNNVKPIIEVKSRRVGGATYQVPVEVRQDRQESLGMRWLVDAANDRNEHSMPERLGAEIIEAFFKRGGAVKKREDVHRMAEANKAFAHYRW